jgi:hypothetical protein
MCIRDSQTPNPNLKRVFVKFALLKTLQQINQFNGCQTLSKLQEQLQISRQPSAQATLHRFLI